MQKEQDWKTEAGVYVNNFLRKLEDAVPKNAKIIDLKIGEDGMTEIIYEE